MPTTSWRVANAEIQRPLGFEQFLTTTDITTDDKVISTELGNRWNQADHFNGWFNIIRGTNNDEVIRRVEDYSGETGQLTLVGANLSGETGAQTCEVSRFHPDDVKRAFNRARQDAFPQVGIVRVVDTIVAGFAQHIFTVPSTIRRVIRVELGDRHEAQTSPLNLFTNGGMEDWSSATSLDDWTVAGAGASINQEIETTSPPNYAVLAGSSSARLVVPSSTETTLLQTVTPDQGTEGMEVNVTGWMYVNTASRMSIRIAGNDGTTHGGTGWERISHVRNLGATATSVAAGIVGSSGSAIGVFIDELIITLGPSEPIDLPYEPILGWKFLPAAAGASNGGTIEMPYLLPSKHRIRIVGVDQLSSVNADSDTFEVDIDLLDPLYNLTRAYMCQERADTAKGRDTIRIWRDRQAIFMAAYDGNLANGKVLRTPRPRLAIPTGQTAPFRRHHRRRHILY
jgi:hypothetical protein